MSQDAANYPFLPLVPPARFQRNFLRQVVCELRFPTVFDLNTSTPPLDFARKVKHAYPHHSHQINQTEVNGDSIERLHVHVFKSKNLDWAVALGASSITIEATKYTSFDELLERVQFLLDIASEIIDSDFFTRVGIRYINTLPMNMVGTNTDNFKGWVRDSLASALLDDDIGLITDFGGRLAGKAEFGTFLFQHGITFAPKTQKTEYLLDFDFASVDVELSDVIEQLKVLRRHQFAMFMWSLGDRAREFLGESILPEE